MFRVVKTGLAASLILFCATVLADDSKDRFEQQMYEQLATASSAEQSRRAESALWEYWFSQAPTAQLYQLLQDGRKRRESYDYAGAERLFDQLVESAPDYAEGYNQRAFVYFLREKYSDAQSDLEKVLAMKPDHFGALSGLYHVLRAQTRLQPAYSMLTRAVEIHPWINERFELPKNLWPKNALEIHQPGQKI